MKIIKLQYRTNSVRTNFKMLRFELYQLHLRLYETVLIMSRIVVSFVFLKYFETACSFRLKDYCFGTLIKERAKFMCSVLVLTHGLLFRRID